ncbi:MAG: hypothetical protein WBR13_08810 [Allosphingosinicella sp.]
MPGKLNLRTMTGLAAGLALAGLSGPASAQRLNEPRPECMQEVQAYCAMYWDESWQPNFSSQAACVDHYDEMCYYEWSTIYY